jgi:alanine dehydrogenase
MSIGWVWCPPACASSSTPGHQVLVQTGAGAGIGFEDSHYQAPARRIAPRAEDVFARPI